MNTQKHALELKIYLFSHRQLESFQRFLERIFIFLSAVFNGFWLGILGRAALHLIDQVYYDNSQAYQDHRYRDETYNRKGLWAWEQKIIDHYFQSCKCLLLLSVGGGREVLALSKLGYEVDGFECNPHLVEFANELIAKEGCNSLVKLSPRDDSPILVKTYDGIIVGWGAYMLIQGRDKRIALLTKLRSALQTGSPILISFFLRPQSSTYFKLVYVVGNLIRWILRQDPLELGDNLAPNYVHHFTQTEIESELQASGFQLALYSTETYGHAVGIAV
jgi:Tellurite resistance protein TehB